MQIIRILRNLNVRALSVLLLLSFGGIFYMGARTSPIIVFVFVVCIISFMLSVYLTKWVLAKDEGPPEMVQVSSHNFRLFIRDFDSVSSLHSVAFLVLCYELFLFRLDIRCYT